MAAARHTLPDASCTWAIEVDVPNNSTVVVNVTGAQLDVGSGQFTLNGVTSERVMWNFHEATTLDIHGTDFKGSALALSAQVDVSAGNFEGSLMVDTLTGSGSAFLWSPFLGQLP